VSAGAAARFLPPRLAARANTMLRIGAQALIAAGCLVIFAISPMLLAHWGVPYDAVGGSAPAKVHPGTWMIALGLFLAALRFSSPLVFGVRAAALFPGLVVFFATWVFLMWYAIIVQRQPFTPMIDSFFLPFAALLGLSTQTDSSKRRIALALHAILFVNALLGLYEYLSGVRLTPYVVGEEELEADWRATALLGHPLSNALTMGVYMIIMSVGGGRDLPAWLRPVATLVALASMIAFGGRTSLVLALAAMAGVFALRFAGVLRGAKVDVRMAAAVIALAPLFGVALAALYASGFFDQMLERFVNDHGSAKARIVMLSFFRHLSVEEILFGPSPDKMGGLQRVEGVEYGLESFFVAYVLTYGALVSGLFFVGVAFFCREIVRASTLRAVLPIVFFFVVAATSVSLSAKTTTLGMLVALVVTMLRPDPVEGRA
jgi:hypothetical protein